MPSPIITRLIIQVLMQHGFVFVSQKGSHAKYRRLDAADRIWNVIVPIHGKDVPFGTFRSIVRQSGLNLEDFMK